MVRPKKISDEQVLEIARDCFLQKGAHVSTQEIAERIGLSQAALFKRFRTKEDLFLAAMASKEVFTKVVSSIAWISSHPVKGEFAPQLHELMQRLWEMMVEVLPRIIAMYNLRNEMSPEKFLAAMKKPPPVRVLEAIVGFVERAKKNGQIRGDADAAAMAMNLMGTMQGRVFFTRIFSQSDNCNDDVYIQETVSNFCSGILPQE